MKKYTFLSVLLVIIFLLQIPALGSPEPQKLVIQDQDARVISIQGTQFGAAPEVGGLAVVVESGSGLKSCVVLGEEPVITSCEKVIVLSVQAWDEETVTAEMGAADPEGPKQMYIYLFDHEGNASIPIGPVDMVDGISNPEFDLTKEQVIYGEQGSVEVLTMTAPDPEPGGPGRPGQPIRNQVR